MRTGLDLKLGRQLLRTGLNLEIERELLRMALRPELEGRRIDKFRAETRAAAMRIGSAYGYKGRGYGRVQSPNSIGNR